MAYSVNISRQLLVILSLHQSVTCVPSYVPTSFLLIWRHQQSHFSVECRLQTAMFSFYFSDLWLRRQTMQIDSNFQFTKAQIQCKRQKALSYPLSTGSVSFQSLLSNLINSLFECLDGCFSAEGALQTDKPEKGKHSCQYLCPISWDAAVGQVHQWRSITLSYHSTDMQQAPRQLLDVNQTCKQIQNSLILVMYSLPVVAGL